MSIDLMSNMLSAIKNASMVGKKSIEVPFSKECEAVAKIIKAEGYLTDVKTFKPKGKAYKMLRLDVAYDDKSETKITQIKRVSTPGLRVYKKAHELNRVLGGFGIMVVSTSRGIMKGDDARKKKLGGEVVCEIW